MVAGSPSIILAVSGSGFVPTSSARWNGSERVTSFLSSTQLKVQILASDLASSGSAQLTVFNPAPGGGESGGFSYTVSPQPPVPTISGLSPSRVFTGGDGFSLQVSGLGFAPNSVVRWNGADRPTAFVSSTQLSATIPASDVASEGVAQVSVFTPAPGGGTSAAFAFNVDYRAVINLAANDLIYDASRQQIYASIPASSPQYANSIAVINPATAAVVSLVAVGSDPAKLALSDNGAYLYLGLRGASKIVRVDLATLSVGQEFALGSDAQSQPYYAEDLEVLSGQPLVVVVALMKVVTSPNIRHGGVAIFDNGVMRPTKTPDGAGSNSITLSASANTLYGYDNETAEYGFRWMTIDASGVVVSATQTNLIEGLNLEIEFASGQIYATNGRVINPVNTTITGTFPLASPSYVRPDIANGKVFFVNNTQVQSFGASTFTLVGSTTVPGVASAVGSLIRWGSDGLAYRTAASVVIIRTPLVAP